jgi:mannose-6-phosphate isomerase-like protein (cupin superfamily)
MTTDGAFVLQPGEGRSIDLGAFSMCVKASAEDTRGAFTLLEADEPPGFGPPLHIHHDAAEAFYVLKGEYRIFLRPQEDHGAQPDQRDQGNQHEQEWRCPAGSFIYIPAGVTHGFRVGDVASSKLNLYLPAAMVGYFDELSAVISRGDDDPAAVERIATRHRMEVVGPVPENYI